MKIVHVCPFYTPAIGGVKQVVEELSKRYIKKGHEVHVYCSDSDKKRRIKRKEETINGVHVHRCRYWFKVANFAYVFPSILWKLWREKNVDIIHSHVFGHAHTFFAALVAKLKGVPLIHTTHCPWTEAYRSLIGRILLFITYRTFGKLSLKWADKIIAITPWEIDFIKRWGGNEEKIVIIPNGMADVFFKKIKNNDFKKKHGIKGKMILFFGRLNITKGPEKLAIAGKELLKKRKDLWFVFIGPDEGMKEKVKEIIKGEKQMILLDPIYDRKEVAKAYQAADLYVLPSYREGLPLTLFEAMASGLPIVASPVNGVPYEMKEPENGLFVKYGDIEGLKKAIEKIIDNPKLARKMSEANLKKSENYRWDTIAEKTLGLYKKVIKEKSKIRNQIQEHGYRNRA